MVSPAQQKIAVQTQTVRHVELWRALQALKSTVSFMNTGAHPDDETSEMLAALGLRDGIALSYACANRGEGGQNDIGIETSEVLGALRTAEMERACDVLGMRMYWLSTSQDDSLFDFGFSKSGEETFRKWGYQRTLKRFVKIVRSERPDIICPTFLNIPGQHGHHRAMTQAAHDVMVAAADPDFPDVDLPVWTVKKLYLPAWSGAGYAYDDDVPPPPATLTLDCNGEDEVTGYTWAQIGEQSRAFHRTQGMGRWSSYLSDNTWQLHLAESRVGTNEQELWDNLPKDLSELAGFAGAPELWELLASAHENCMAAIAAFPNRKLISGSAAKALAQIRQALVVCPAQARDEIVHRLKRKEAELERVLTLSCGIQGRLFFENEEAEQGEALAFDLELNDPALKAHLKLPEDWHLEGDKITLSQTAACTDAYPATYFPNQPQTPCAVVSHEIEGVQFQAHLSPDFTPLVLPSRIVELEEERFVVNLTNSSRVFELSVAGPTDIITLGTPKAWKVQTEQGKLEVELPEDIAAGLYEIPVFMEGEQAFTVKRIKHSHIRPTASISPALLRVLVLDVALSTNTIGYVGGGNDRVGKHLAEIGAQVHELGAGELTSHALKQLDTLVLGIFALKFRPDLREMMPQIHEWVRAGGKLLTLYHRPWDNWDKDSVPLAPLEIGSPSLRWRVTDENAQVHNLQEDHSLLSQPNKMRDVDWTGWHKERGLYFAKKWDDAYTPLLAMADPNEQPHHGILLTGAFGEGQHIHTSLILHHQMEKLVPGAFRLMANLVS